VPGAAGYSPAYLNLRKAVWDLEHPIEAEWY